MSEFVDNAKDVLGAVKDDIASIPAGGEKVVAGVLAGGLVAHEVGNGTGLGLLAANVYAATNSVPLTILSVFAASLAAESALSVGVASHLSDFERTSAALAKIHANRPDWHLHIRHGRIDRVLSRGRAVMMAIGLGAAGTVTDEFARNPNADRAVLMRRGLRASRKLALWHTAVVGTLTTGVKIAEKTGHEQAAEAAVHVAKNPLLYLGVLATGVAVGSARKWHVRRVARRQAEIPTQRESQEDSEREPED